MGQAQQGQIQAPLDPCGTWHQDQIQALDLDSGMFGSDLSSPCPISTEDRVSLRRQQELKVRETRLGSALADLRGMT